MKFGINTLLWTADFDARHLDLLPRIKSWGFDGVEIARFGFDSFPAAEIRRALQANGLDTTFCSALTGRQSLGSPERAVRDQTLEFLKQAVDTAAEIGCRVLAGPFCSAVGYLPGRRRTREEWLRTVEGLQQLGPRLDHAGITLAVEPLNRFETYFLNTAADARQLCTEVGHPRIGVLFDTFHGNIEEKSTSGAIAAVAPFLRHVHACENDRGTPGTGQVPWRELGQALRAADYDEWLVIESFGFAVPEIAAAACIWRDLAPDAEEIASKGVRFLRANFPAQQAG